MKQAAPPPAPTTHRSLERGLAAIELLAGAGAPLPLSEAARRLGLHRSTAHHLLQTLVALGWARQEEDSRAYTLTSRVHRITGRKWSVHAIGEVAQPLLARLSTQTGEGTSVAAWTDGQVTIAAKHESAGPVRVVQDVGAVRPMYCTAVGKALAAWLPPAEVRAALASQPMKRLTPKTLTSASAFESELRRIRAAGYAIDDQEQFEGLRCIAMPVFGYSGEVVAAMCVLGPLPRMTHEKLQAVRAPLAAAARELSLQLGWEPAPAREHRRQA